MDRSLTSLRPSLARYDWQSKLLAEKEFVSGEEGLGKFGEGFDALLFLGHPPTFNHRLISRHE